MNGEVQEGAGPVLLEELVRRTAGDTDWTWSECICCGKPPVHYGVTLLKSGRVRRVAWCSRTSCETDRRDTDYAQVTR